MAIAFVQQTAKAQVAPNTVVTTATLTTTTGNLVVITCSLWRSSANEITVSDSKSNTWVVDRSIKSGTANDKNGRAVIASCVLANAGASHTFSVTCTSGSAYMEMNASEFSGILSTSPTDKVAQDQGGAADTTCVPTTATLAQADELAIACLNCGAGDAAINISTPPSTGWTNIGVNQNGSATIGYEASYKIVAATTAVSATWTFDAAPDADGDIGVIATYLQATAGAAAGAGGFLRLRGIRPNPFAPGVAR